MNEYELVSLYHDAISVFFTVVTIMIPPDMPWAMTWFVRIAVILSLLYGVPHRRAQKQAAQPVLP